MIIWIPWKPFYRKTESIAKTIALQLWNDHKKYYINNTHNAILIGQFLELRNQIFNINTT